MKFFAAFEKIWMKVMMAVSAVLVVVIGLIIGMNIRNQHQILADQSQHDEKMLATAIYGGMSDALAVGNNQVVVKQFERLNESVPGLEVHIFDFKGDITFSTHEEAVGKRVSEFNGNPEATAAISKLLGDGQDRDDTYEDLRENQPYLTVFKPILNANRCHHCHGSSRNVLGGMQVSASIAKAQNAALSSRNQSIIAGICGLVVVVFIIYFLFQIVVNRPITALLDLAGKMRQGDLSHRLKTRSHDEINHMINRMNRVNDSLVNMIGEIVEASGLLSSATQQQAAALEETSASLEEMSSMTSSNADNAKQADSLMVSAKAVVDNAKEAMVELNGSMNAISQSSQETSKIIKTIDEIAFQTNLLALNAAVEAARAGEAGAGFAVVADEVRNLAMRAAEAAKSTSTMIEGTVDNINNGSGLVSRVNEEFEEIFASMEKTADLISEIAAASGEQAIGIEQINKTVIEIDKATQNSAATSETLAAAAGSFIITSDTGGQDPEQPVLHRPQLQPLRPSHDESVATAEVDDSTFSDF